MSDKKCTAFIATPEGRTGSLKDRLYMRLGELIGFDSDRRVILTKNGEKFDEIMVDWNTTASIEFPIEE